MEKEIKIIRFPELKETLGVSRNTIDRWERDSNFPKRIRLGKNSIGWDAHLIDIWLKQRQE